MKWYKRDPDAALVGMTGLTLEERGAYNTLIDISYSRDGKVPDDDKFMVRHLGCHWRTWKRIKKNLTAKGKIRVVDGYLIANRVLEGVKEAARYAQEQRKNAENRWKSTPDPMPLTTTYKNTLTSSLHSVPREAEKHLNNSNGKASPVGHPSPGPEMRNFRKAEHQAKKDAKRLKARQAWEADLVRQLGANAYATAIEILAEHPELADRATDAELREPGSGTTAAVIGMQRHLRGAA